MTNIFRCEKIVKNYTVKGREKLVLMQKPDIRDSKSESQLRRQN